MAYIDIIALNINCQSAAFVLRIHFCGVKDVTG